MQIYDTFLLLLLLTPDTAPVIIVQILRSLNTEWCRGPLVQLIIIIIRVEFNLNLTPILNNYIAIQPNMKTITACYCDVDFIGNH